MALTNPRTLFGIHSITPYSTTTFSYYGILQVLAESTLALNGELIELRGGSNPYPWKVENSNIDTTLNINCSEYPDFMFELCLGKAPTANTAESSGNATAITDVKGTSVVAATGLLSTVTVSTAADLKFGRYIIKATGAAAASIYFSSNVDITRGTDDDFDDDLLLIHTISSVGSGSTHVITGHGLTLTAGASAGAFVTGDTAYFDVRPVNSKSMEVTIGAPGNLFPEFGALIYGQKMSDDTLYEIDAFTCKVIGMPLGASEKSFSSYQLSGKLSYNASRGGLFKFRHVTGA